jgi:hypothetical protein
MYLSDVRAGQRLRGVEEKHRGMHVTHMKQVHGYPCTAGRVPFLCSGAGSSMQLLALLFCAPNGTVEENETND